MRENFTACSYLVHTTLNIWNERDEVWSLQDDLELKGIRSVTNNKTKGGGKQLWHQHMRVGRGRITELKARLKKQNGEWNKYPKRLYENQIDSDMKRRAKRIRIVIWPIQEILHEANWKYCIRLPLTTKPQNYAIQILLRF